MTRSLELAAANYNFGGLFFATPVSNAMTLELTKEKLRQLSDGMITELQNTAGSSTLRVPKRFLYGPSSIFLHAGE